MAMDSTTGYRRPLWNLLEGRFELLLCNAQHIKKLAGRKTDVKDRVWIAQLVQHGLSRRSFVPPRPLRELRESNRRRAQRVDEKTPAANRLHKVLEDANVMLSSVASGLLGVSGRAMLEALCAGQQKAEHLAGMARGTLRRRILELREALLGSVTEHHRFMHCTLMQHLRTLQELGVKLSTRIEELIRQADAQRPPSAARATSAALSDPATGSAPSEATTESPVEGQDPEPHPCPQGEGSAPFFSEAVASLDTIPGVDQCAAQCLVAEAGKNMAQFPESADLASWVKLCPGNSESAGKRKAAATGEGNRRLRLALGQAACSAARLRKRYFSAQFRRLSTRRGKARAVAAVAHSILVAICHMPVKRVPFQDLGPDFFERRNPETLAGSRVRRLEAPGHQVILQPQGALV